MEPTENIPASEIARGEQRLSPEQRALTRAQEGLCRHINPDKDLTPGERPVFDKMFKLAEERALQAEREATGRDPIEFICDSLSRIAERSTAVSDDERQLLKIKMLQLRGVQARLQAAWDALKASEHSGGEPATPAKLYKAFIQDYSSLPSIDLTTGMIEKGNAHVYVEGSNRFAFSILQELGFLIPNETLAQRTERAEKPDSGERVDRNANTNNTTYLVLNSPQIGEGLYAVVYTPGKAYRPKTDGLGIIDVRLCYNSIGIGPDYQTPIANAIRKSVR